MSPRMVGTRTRGRPPMGLRMGPLLGLIFLGLTWAAGGASELEAQDHAAFLEQLAGVWTGEAAATLGPGQDPVRYESRETARQVGNWLVAESTGTTSAGVPFTGILTLGYDPAREEFVATWIDSAQTHLWSYAGTLDESGTALTLETEGPFMGDPTTTTEYRVVLQIEDDGRKVQRSLILGPDGEWFEFSRVEFRRIE